MWPSLILPPIARILFVEARICFVKNPKLILVRFVIVTPGERKGHEAAAVQIVLERPNLVANVFVHFGETVVLLLLGGPLHPGNIGPLIAPLIQIFSERT